MKILTDTGFRVHLLIPNKIIGAIRDDWTHYWIQREPLGPNEDRWNYEGEPVIHVTKAIGPHVRGVRLTALQEIWIQEPGQMVMVEGEGGFWRGFGPEGQWTSDRHYLHQKDPHISTVHFPRYHTNKDFTVGVQYQEGADVGRWKIHDPGFQRFLKTGKPGVKNGMIVIPWKGCKVGVTDYELAGTYYSDEVLQRLELSAVPGKSQMYFFGWTGGPAGCVNTQGRAEGKMNQLYNPRAWRKMEEGQSISYSIVRMI